MYQRELLNWIWAICYVCFNPQFCMLLPTWWTILIFWAKASSWWSLPSGCLASCIHSARQKQSLGWGNLFKIKAWIPFMLGIMIEWLFSLENLVALPQNPLRFQTIPDRESWVAATTLVVTMSQSCYFGKCHMFARSLEPILSFPAQWKAWPKHLQVRSTPERPASAVVWNSYNIFWINGNCRGRTCDLWNARFHHPFDSG